MTETIQIVVVDNQPLFGAGVTTVLEAEPGVEIVGQGTTAEEAIYLACNRLPNIILLSLDLTDRSLNTIRVIADECPATRVAFLTASEEDEHIIEVLRAGAKAYILKRITGPELIGVLRSVHTGQSYVPPALAARLILKMNRDNFKHPHRFKAPIAVEAAAQSRRR